MFHRFIAVFLIVVVAISVNPTPSAAALATSPECQEGFERIAQLVRQERRRGVTPEWLGEINGLVPFLIDCVSADPEGDQVGTERWGPLASSFFRVEDLPRVLCLMGHESKGNPSAVNPTSGAAGLMQVMPFWAPRFGYDSDDLLDPMVNLEVASWILDHQGWTAWSPYNRGLCR